jgi:hypothetical protein
MRAANQQVQRSINRSLILSKVRREKAVSRVALSRSTGLEKSSVSMIVNDLLRRGLLVQQTQGKVSSASGRRPVDLRINAQYCSFLGIEVQPRHYRACLMDLGGGIIHKEKGEVQISPGGFHGVLAAIFEKLEPHVDALSLAAVSIGIPGYVNPHLGRVYRSVPLGLSDFDFGHPLSPWGAPLWVENDANCCAWAELIDPHPEEARNFLVLLMEYQEANPLVGQEAGISTGFAIVIGGEVYYGSDYASGEFKSLFSRRAQARGAGDGGQRAGDRARAHRRREGTARRGGGGAPRRRVDPDLAARDGGACRAHGADGARARRSVGPVARAGGRRAWQRRRAARGADRARS